MTIVDIKSFYKDQYTFPWDYVGLDIPKWGTLHSYLARVASIYSKDIFNPSFLASNPLLGELEKYATEKEEYIVEKIVDYCQRRYELSDFDRGSVADEVVFFLSTYDEFSTFFRKKIQYDYSMGYIKLQSKYLFYKDLT